MEFRRPSSGTAKAGLATGIVGTSLGVLNAAGNGIGWFGNYAGRNNGETVVVNPGFGYGYGGCCSENMPVTRYELELEQEIANKDAQIALRDANFYTVSTSDQKMLEMYKYLDAQLKDIREKASEQAVINQKTADSFQIVSERMDCLRNDMRNAIANEAKERRCADDTLVTYMNATFYAKNVADVTVGTETTPQSTYNPLPCCSDNNCC